MLLNGQTIKPPLDIQITAAPSPQTSFSAVDEIMHSEHLWSAQPCSSQVQGTSRKSGEGKTLRTNGAGELRETVSSKHNRTDALKFSAAVVACGRPAIITPVSIPVWEGEAH